ncbi:hypothetical protein Q4E93_00675 [Flavitalea sp. BT771]|uniref:hypothetical protein n=1 Tax=Flavitalea sp. BT771 TaxID=3063329 RepID=UPI0026E444EB|nr:hypothetical protein [Flavitalea sp. BT771]MDO6429078.1 hypothetical protein [Flavitalea sp. BT771]MDV6218794.1 hypothetical protein [Flavitalea sp. BT771]
MHSQITSKFKPYGIFSLIFCGFLFLLLLLVIGLLGQQIALWNARPVRKGITPAQALLFMAIFGFLAWVIVFTLYKYAFRVVIDPAAKTILFKHLLTQSSKRYDFDDFDGYLDTFAVSKSGDYKVVYLVKDQKAEKIITGFYFANIDELKAALSPVKYLGFEEDFRRLARRALSGKPLID